jgi:hypothetical protein
MKPWVRRRDRASRITGTLTPNSPASAVPEGSFSPTATSPR